jgi:phi13 family phage major tail protein
VLTEAKTGGATTYSWGTPVAVPGAVNLNLEQQGEITKFYADGIVYYQSPVNNGYEGDLEMARIVDKMLQDVWGMTLGTTSKVLTENANTEAKAFALLFQIDGDADEDCYVLYNCTGTRPAIAAKTKEDTKEPQTQSSTISAAPLGNGNVMARTTSETPEATKNSWFNEVFVEGAA